MPLLAWVPLRTASLTHLAAVAATPALIAAQSPDSLVAGGDQRFASRDGVAALAAYDRALALDSNHYRALWHAAGVATEVGEFLPDAAQRTALYARARAYAERAVRANPDGAEGHFQLARAVGRTAQAAGVRERVRLATLVRTHAAEALARDSLHDGAMHVLGMWHAEIMRLSGLQRTFAKAFLGGKVMGEASWDAAVSCLERAAAWAPNRIVHRLDLGMVYLDRQRRDDARAQFEWIAQAPVTDYNDASYKRLAADALRGIK
jgi:tetratricopeptide (TPR) repeat protein